MMTYKSVQAPPLQRLPKTRLLTYEQYAKMTPPDSGNYELHKGQIIAMPTPTPLHQLVSANLLTEITMFTRKAKNGRVLSAPMDTVFSPNDVLQPDILFLSSKNLHLIGEKKIEGAPDLVVEILSPSNSIKEMAYKKMIYEMSGVLEYWVIHLENQTITQYLSIEGEFLKKNIFTKTDILKSEVIENFALEVSSIFV